MGALVYCQPVETERSEDMIPRKIFAYFSARQVRPAWLAREFVAQSTKSKSLELPGVWDRAQGEVSGWELGVLTLLCDSAQATSPLFLCVLSLLITMPSVTVGISYQ